MSIDSITVTESEKAVGSGGGRVQGSEWDHMLIDNVDRDRILKEYARMQAHWYSSAVLAFLQTLQSALEQTGPHGTVGYRRYGLF